MPPKFEPKIVVDGAFMELPQLGMLAHYCGKPKLHAAGALLRLWLHLQSRGDSRIVEISKAAIDIATEISGFASAMIEAKLATQLDGTTIDFELFDEYISRKSIVRKKDASKKQLDRGYELAVESVLVFPCNGTPSEWPLTKAQVDEWSKLYDGIDVLAEMKKALAWILANRKKTYRGCPAFCVNWLNRAANSGRAAKSPTLFSKPQPDLKQKIRDEMEAKRRADEEKNRGRYR